MMTTQSTNQPTAPDTMLTLARWIAGDFSNQAQVFANPQSYASIRLFFRPLPWKFFAGIGFYSEQVYNHDLWTPYRQGVHRFVEQNNRVYVENYSLHDHIRYAGAGRDLDILKTITPDCIERRCNCSMVFQYIDDRFQGQVEGNSCLIEKRGKQTYLVSEVELTASTFSTFDRGLDVDTHEYVWGSTSGPLIFEKRASFADEIVTRP